MQLELRKFLRAAALIRSASKKKNVMDSRRFSLFCINPADKQTNVGDHITTKLKTSKTTPTANTIERLILRRMLFDVHVLFKAVCSKTFTKGDTNCILNLSPFLLMMQFISLPHI